MSFTYVVQEPENHPSAVIRFDGTLDMDERDAFNQALNRLLETEREIVLVDLSLLTRISSLFLGSLMDYASRMHDRNKQLVVKMNVRLEKACTTVGLDKLAQMVYA